jgi:hypothetical protein
VRSGEISSTPVCGVNTDGIKTFLTVSAGGKLGNQFEGWVVQNESFKSAK